MADLVHRKSDSDQKRLHLQGLEQIEKLRDSVNMQGQKILVIPSINSVFHFL